MTHWTPDDDEDDDDLDEVDDGDERLLSAELPDPADTDPPADDLDTVPCPFCGRAVYEFADVCPRCRNFLGGSDQPVARKPWWVIGLVVALVAVLLTCAVRMW